MKLGRPLAGTEPGTLKTIHVRIDSETEAALKRLERALGDDADVALRAKGGR
jgi:hypothetical protein